MPNPPSPVEVNVAFFGGLAVLTCNNIDFLGERGDYDCVGQAEKGPNWLSQAK